MRQVLDHVCNPVNDQIVINVVDPPGPEGANHRYEAFLPDGTAYCIDFQNGPINEVGINGLTQEVLMAICVDRLRSFQAGPFACRENAVALTKLEESLMWLHKRTRNRIARGVEGQTKA